VERERPSLALQLGLRLQEFRPQAPRRGDEAGLVSGIDRMRFLDEPVGVSHARRWRGRSARESLALAEPSCPGRLAVGPDSVNGLERAFLRVVIGAIGRSCGGHFKTGHNMAIQ
jgi:hypothetical protein